MLTFISARSLKSWLGADATRSRVGGQKYTHDCRKPVTTVGHTVPPCVTKLSSALWDEPQTLLIIHIESWAGPSDTTSAQRSLRRPPPIHRAPQGLEASSPWLLGWVPEDWKVTWTLRTASSHAALQSRAFHSGVQKRGTLTLALETANQQNLSIETSLKS